MAGLLAPGPTLAMAEELRKRKGSRGLLEAVGGPMSYAPNPVVAALGQGLLGARYLTGEKSPEEGLASLSDMTAMIVGSRLPAPLRNIIAYHGSPNKFDKINVQSDSTNDLGLLGPQATQRHGGFFHSNPKFSAEYGEVSKWDLKPKKVAQITPELRDEFLETLDPFGPDRSLWVHAKHGAKADWMLFENELGKRFTAFLKAKGYDAAKFKEYTPTKSGGEVGGWTTVVLDPAVAKKL